MGIAGFPSQSAGPWSEVYPPHCTVCLSTDPSPSLYTHCVMKQNDVFKVMTYSHCTGTGPEQVQGTAPGAMGTNILYRNVHTGLRQGKEPGPIVSYCARWVSRICPGSVFMQREEAINILTLDRSSVIRNFAFVQKPFQLTCRNGQFKIFEKTIDSKMNVWFGQFNFLISGYSSKMEVGVNSWVLYYSFQVKIFKIIKYIILS